MATISNQERIATTEFSHTELLLVTLHNSARIEGKLNVLLQALAELQANDDEDSEKILADLHEAAQENAQLILQNELIAILDKRIV